MLLDHRYDATTGIRVCQNVSVVLGAAPATGTSGGDTTDSLVQEILGRYQTLLRNKASASVRFRADSATLPLLSTVTVTISDLGSKGTTLGPLTDESYV